MKRDATLAAYIWNRGKENMLLQDFEVRVIVHWPQKWQFWE